MSPNNPFSDFPSGLMSDYDFYIKEASFIRDAQYNQGLTTQLELKGNAVKDGVLVADDHTERYNCPKDWSSKDEGLTVQHSGTATNFNKNSQIAKFYMAVSDCAPDLVMNWSKAGETPQGTTHLIGQAFHMAEQTEKFVIDGQARESTRNYPSSYLGKVSVSGDSGSTGTAGGNGGSAGSEADFIAKLKPLAQAHSHEDFVNAALAIPGVSGYSGLVKRIADPDDLYAELQA